MLSVLLIKNPFLVGTLDDMSVRSEELFSQSDFLHTGQCKGAHFVSAAAETFGVPDTVKENKSVDFKVTLCSVAFTVFVADMADKMFLPGSEER